MASDTDLPFMTEHFPFRHPHLKKKPKWIHLKLSKSWHRWCLDVVALEKVIHKWPKFGKQHLRLEKSGLPGPASLPTRKIPTVRPAWGLAGLGSWKRSLVPFGERWGKTGVFPGLTSAEKSKTEPPPSRSMFSAWILEPDYLGSNPGSAAYACRVSLKSCLTSLGLCFLICKMDL